MTIKAQKAKTKLENRRMDVIISKIHTVLRKWKMQYERPHMQTFRRSDGTLSYGVVLYFPVAKSTLPLNMIYEMDKALYSIGVELEYLSPFCDRGDRDGIMFSMKEGNPSSMSATK